MFNYLARNPIMNDLTSIHEDFARFEKFFNNVFSTDQGIWKNYGSFPKMNLWEDESKFVLEAAIAGYSKEDVKVEIEEDYLKISGSQFKDKLPNKKEQEIENKKKYHLQELKGTAFTKSIYLPAVVDRDNIKVKLVEGILNIEIPKKEPDLPKKTVLEIE